MLLVRITVTTSPSLNVVVVNLSESVPLSTPLTCHWYDGLLPPLVGVAVNVTEVPLQIDVVLAAILTLGSTLVDVMVTGLLVVVGVDAQARSLVRITVTTLPSFNVVVVKVGASVPAFTPLICHWYDGLVPPLVGVAVNVTEVPLHIVVDEAAMLTAGSTLVEVIVTGLLVAVGVEAQARSLVRITVTTSPSFNVVVVKVGASVPAFTPLICHWYDGLVPPLVGVAVNVTDVPVQIVVEEAAMLTLGSTLVDVIVTGLLVAVGVEAQARLLVRITVTTSPSLSVLVVKVGASVPALTPLTCHWYDGLLPPLVGVAVNVTEVPVQIDVALALMITLGSTLV